MPKSKWIIILLACLILAGGIFYWQKEMKAPPAEISRQAVLPAAQPASAAERFPENETEENKAERDTAITAEAAGRTEETAEPEESEETEKPEGPEESEEWIFATEPLMVNINTAGEAELQKLPGIGPGKAQAILQYRQKHGPFHAIEELMQVPGIKEGTFAKLKDYVTV